MSTATGTVSALEAQVGKIYPETLEGEEYYTITSDTNVHNWKNQKQYFEETEIHYLTDEGEAFFLPGYLVQEDDGSQKWFINESKYYYGDKITGDRGENDSSGETEESVQLTDDNIGDFVEYGIEYTDVYNDTYTYNSKNGWRLLSQTPVGDGTYNIEIISTGIPAKLNNNYSSIGSAPWCGTDGTNGTEDQLGKYATNYYASSSNTNLNMKAAAGLLYNFEKVNFIEQATYDTLSTSERYNNGYYTSISGSHSGAGNLFKASNIALGKMSVRSAMHTDLVPTSAKADIGNITLEDIATGLFTFSKILLRNAKFDRFY